MAELAQRQPEPFCETVCFHAQQAAEKALKGLLISRGRPYPRTHDVKRLVLLAAHDRPGVRRLADEADSLSQYAGEGRYPDVEGTELTRGDAAVAIRSARRIVAAVMPPARTSKTGR